MWRTLSLPFFMSNYKKTLTERLIAKELDSVID